MSSRSTPCALVLLSLALLLSPTSRVDAQWTFERGDCNADGALDIGDPIALLGELFSGQPPGPCADACDANDDGAKDIGDPITLLGHLFSGTGPLPPPFGACGDDPSADPLGCAGPFPGCPAIAGYDYSLREPPRVPPAAPCRCHFSQPDRPGHRTSLPTDSVHLFSCEFFEEWVDLRIPGVGLDFVWARKYRSRLPIDGVIGHQWDHSYDIRIEADGASIVLRDGNARRELLTAVGGTYASDGLFATGSFGPTGQFTLLFGNGGEWRLAPLDGSPIAGKIQQIRDRHGNTISCGYDAAGRLVQVIDTLGRAIAVSYDAAGRIASVADFAGRTVSYAYYDGVAPGGSAGDLRWVDSPAVIGTPNLNDYPAGKRTTYRYDDAHRLTEIVAPSGRTILVNTYADSGPFAGQVVRQDLDDAAAGHIDLWNGPVVPTPANGNAVIRCIVNDSRGVVREYWYDALNRCVLAEEYTGFADPTVPTTPTENRPTGPLRPGDPPLFATRFTWNEDSLQTGVTYANGNTHTLVYERTLDPGASPRTRGNLRQSLRSPGTHIPPGDQSQTLELLEVLPDFGGCCAADFVTMHLNVCGDVTTHAYDALANRLHTERSVIGVEVDREYDAAGRLTAIIHPSHSGAPPFDRRRDEFTYHTSGPQAGTLATRTVDAGGAALVTSFGADDRGNLVSVTDPSGEDTLYTYNALDQVVQKLSRVIDPTTGTRYETLYFYDADDRLVRTCRENRDGDGVLVPGNVYVTAILEYDARGRLVRRCEESGAFDFPPAQLDCAGLPASEFVTTEYEHDETGLLTRLRFGEATAGTQPANTETFVRDERGLVFAHIRGESSPEESTDRYDYDPNGNLVRTERGLPIGGRITQNTWDGYDRLIASTDPMGNVVTQNFDPAGHRTHLRIDGEIIDLPGSASNVRLWEAFAQYDAIGRMTLEEVAFFVPTTQATIGDGFSSTIFTYNANSQWIARMTDDGATTVQEYDGVGRPSTTTDALGNERSYGYDADSRPVSITEVEQATISSVPSETFVTTAGYDALGRLTAHTDSIGNEHAFRYDSRGNLVRHVDARGNVTRMEYDGLSRPTATHRDLTDTGDGAGTIVAIATTTEGWDRSSRLVARTDANGNATQYEYDALQRLFQTTYADGTTESTAYDVFDDAVSTTDPNGTVVATTHDLLGRPIERSILPGPGVSADTTFDSLRYDGLSHLARADDDDSVITRRFDSLFHLITETRDGLITTNTWDGVGNMLSMTYPNGRQLQCTYDLLRRKTAITEPSTGFLFAGYEYIGPSHRVLTKSCGTGTVAAFSYDGARRISRIQQVLASPVGPQVIDDREYDWTPQYSRNRRSDLRPGGTGITEDYSYDSLGRLTLASETDAFGGLLGQTSYLLDLAGNRTAVTGGACPGTYLLDPTLPEPADLPMHQYTATPCGARTYDANGNLVTEPSAGGPARTYVYDHRNRLVEFSDGASGTTVAFAYDGLGRRIEKTVSDPAGGTATTRSYYDGMHVVEERDGAGLPRATYAHGNLIDELLHIRRHLGTVIQDLYCRLDDHGSVQALAGASGQPVERVEYDEYGAPSFTSGSGLPLAGTAFGNPYLFTGRRYDAELGHYWYRTRGYDPEAGRFLGRDTIGIWGDPLAQGNGFAYVGNDPASHRDPTGRGSKEKFVRDKPHVNIGILPTSKQSIDALLSGAGFAAPGALPGPAARDQVIDFSALFESGTSASKPDKRKQSLYFPESMLELEEYRPGDLASALPSEPAEMRRWLAARSHDAGSGPIDPPSLVLESGSVAMGNKLFVGGLSWDTADAALAGSRLFVGNLSWDTGDAALASKKLFVGGLSWDTAPQADPSHLRVQFTGGRGELFRGLYIGGPASGTPTAGDPDRPLILGTVPNGADAMGDDEPPPPKPRKGNGRSTVRPHDL